MNKKVIQTIQDQVLKLLPIKYRNGFGFLLTDSCSEVTRLVADWIIKRDKLAIPQIIKGVNVCGTKKMHDILLVTVVNHKIYIIDPTVWQFFPKANSILVATTTNLKDALSRVSKVYGGQWEKGEPLTFLSPVRKRKYLRIIKQNIGENLKLYRAVCSQKTLKLK